MNSSDKLKLFSIIIIFIILNYLLANAKSKIEGLIYFAILTIFTNSIIIVKNNQIAFYKKSSSYNSTFLKEGIYFKWFLTDVIIIKLHHSLSTQAYLHTVYGKKNDNIFISVDYIIDIDKISLNYLNLYVDDNINFDETNYIKSKSYIHNCILIEFDHIASKYDNKNYRLKSFINEYISNINDILNEYGIKIEKVDYTDKIEHKSQTKKNYLDIFFSIITQYC